MNVEMQTDLYKQTSKRFECASCRIKNRMYQICAGEGSASYIDPDLDELVEPDYHPWHGTHFAGFTWLVLLCSNCEQINFFEQRTFADDAYETETGSAIQPVDTRRLYPLIDSTLPVPHVDLPDELRKDYVEALRVYPISPRAACALLRLLIQKLCKVLGGKGEHIDTDIKKLASIGLPDHIQQSLDIIRVVGNSAVHPGQIDVDDNPKIAKDLFRLVNLIVEEMIGIPKRQAIYKQDAAEQYQNLPKTKREYIEQRDNKKPRAQGSSKRQRQPGSAKDIIEVLSEDDKHLDDFSEYMP